MTRISFALRGGALLAVSLAASGCWVSTGDVPAIERTFAERPVTPPLADGIYCAFEAEDDALATSDSCIRFDWIAEDRQFAASGYRGIDDFDSPGIMVADVVALTADVSLIQFDRFADEDRGADDPRYGFLTAVIFGDGFVVIPPLDLDDEDGVEAMRQLALSSNARIEEYQDTVHFPAGAPEDVRGVLTGMTAVWLDSFNAYVFAPSASDGGPVYHVRVVDEQTLPSPEEVAGIQARYDARLRRAASNQYTGSGQ